MSLFKELVNLEAHLFPTEKIKVTQARIEQLLELPYNALQVRRNENQAIDGICLSVFIDDRIETWLSNSPRSNTIYNLPNELVSGLFAESDAIWLDLVAGLSSAGKVWAVRQAVRSLNSKGGPSRVYSYAVTDDGRSLAIKLGLNEALSSGLYRESKHE